MDTLIGQRLGQYKIIAKIGAGGMATVYRARQASVDRDVALKVIRADLMEDENFLGRFQREARMIASLQHLHVLKVFDYGNEGSIAYLVMELLEGGSLNRLLRRSGALPLPLAIRMLDQISMALDYAHGRGIIHRDLKPDNVLLDQHQNAFLTDFGIAKLLSETTSYTRTGMVMGTPAYMAPELWSGQPADARADIYALGVILYEMVTGVSPFSGDTPFHIMHRHIYEMPPSARDVNNSLPATVDSVIQKALAKDANQRFANAGQLAEAFREALNGQDISRLVLNAGDLTSPVPADFLQPTPVRSSAELAAPTLPPNLPEFGTPAPSRVPTMPHPQERRRGTPLVILALILIAAVIGVGVFAAISANRGAIAETQSALDLTITAQVLASEGTATSQAILLLPTFTETASEAPSSTPTAAPTETPSATLTPTLTETPSRTPSSTPSATQTATASATPSATPTLTTTASPTASATPSATPTPTLTPSHTATLTPTVDTAAIVAATLAPIQTATALAVQIQQTVDAVLGADRATANAEATRREQQNQIVTATLRAAQTLAQRTLDAQATRLVIDTQGTLRAIEQNATRTATAQFANITPTAVRCPGFLTSRLVVGGYGRITPGDPNRLREVPGGVILTQILAGETFRILEGPVCTENSEGLGLAWWRVEYLNPRNNRTYIGWTAEGSGGVYWIEPINRP